MIEEKEVCGNGEYVMYVRQEKENKLQVEYKGSPQPEAQWRFAENQVCPVRNVTWILLEIPCHSMSQIEGSLVKIVTKFCEYSMSLIVLFVFQAQS